MSFTHGRVGLSRSLDMVCKAERIAFSSDLRCSISPSYSTLPMYRITIDPTTFVQCLWNLLLSVAIILQEQELRKSEYGHINSVECQESKNITRKGTLCLLWSVQANCTNVASARLMSKQLSI